MRICIAFAFDLANRGLQSHLDAAGLDAIRQLRELMGPAVATALSWEQARPAQDCPVAGRCTVYRADGSRDTDSSAAFTAVMQRTADEAYDRWTTGNQRRSMAARAAAVARWSQDGEE